MILSILKILFFFAVVLALTLFAVRLSETGDALYLAFGGKEYVLGPIQTFVAIVLLFIAVWLIAKLLGLAVAFLRFLMGDQTAISRYFARSRERKGYEALSEGMLAVASGEGKLAQEKAARAAKLLDRPHVTDLLAAQAAEVAGDAATANTVYRRLLADDRTRFVGVRGLMRQKLAEGDTATALKLAEKAYALKPRHAEVQDTLLALQTGQGDWKGARAILKDKRKQGALPQDVHLRRDAVLALQEAKEVLAHGNSISAREAAISANRASPDLIPAAVLAARSYIAQKDFRNAARVLQKTWSVRPHPAVAAAYAEIVPEETPAQRLKRFEALMSKNPDDEETHLLRAELALTAEDFPAARRALGDLAQTHPTVRSLSIMAAIERGEGSDDAVVRGWLARALTASRGPQWVCDKCHNIMADWAPVCDNCGGFDTLTWREPEQPSLGVGTTGNGAEVLPLIVGTPARPAVTELEIEEEVVAEPPRKGPIDITPPEPMRPATKAPDVVAPSSSPQGKQPDYEPSSTVRTPDDAVGAPAEGNARTRRVERPREVIESGPHPVRPDVEPIDPDEGPSRL
ncbi:heme biosynthesis protein HemY [Paracoccus pacificus]|uniref:Heme biosynthesis HemY N-terminal domain-containing protein n=1 Tax=Paracoccus pacificus TaxID=1463598 RepID=A0ABW4R249_9RHOB